MSKAKLIYLIAIFSILSNPIHSQSDSLRSDKVKSFKLYYSSGFGFGSRGGTFGFGGIFIGSNNWGGSIGYKNNILKSRDVPSDYYDDGNRTFAPRDYLTLVSLILVKEFSTSDKLVRFGIEAGPSWVKYNVAQFELNTSYDPTTAPWFGNVYKYHKSHIASRTIGLTLRGKTEFFQTRYSGFELAVFTNLNDVKSVIGIELYVDFGKVRE